MNLSFCESSLDVSQENISLLKYRIIDMENTQN